MGGVANSTGLGADSPGLKPQLFLPQFAHLANEGKEDYLPRRVMWVRFEHEEPFLTLEGN